MKNLRHYLQKLTRGRSAYLMILILIISLPFSSYAEKKCCKYTIVKEKKIPAATVGKEYIQRIMPVDKNEKDVKWRLLDSNQALPKGLKFCESGFLMGTPISKGKFNFIVEKQFKEDDKAKRIHYQLIINVDPVPTLDFGACEKLRLIGGYEFSMGSDTESKTNSNGYADFYFSMPLVSKYSKKLQQNWLHAWGNIRFASTPRANEESLDKLSTTYFNDLSKLKLNELASSLELLAGLDFTLIRTDTKDGHVTTGIVLALGVIYSPSQDNEDIKIYEYSDAVKERFGEETHQNHPSDPSQFAFIHPKRDPFYFQCYGGLRFKTYSSKKDDCSFPAMADVMIGFNKAACGYDEKLFENPVVRLDGFLPIKLLNKVPMYLQGTLVAHMNKIKQEMPLFLKEVPVDDQLELHSPDLLKIVMPEVKRTYFRISVGVDLLSLLKPASS